MTGGEQLFVALAIVAFSLYGAALLWLTFTYHDEQKLLSHDG
jgi:hypothetical protein